MNEEINEGTEQIKKYSEELKLNSENIRLNTDELKDNTVELKKSTDELKKHIKEIESQSETQKKSSDYLKDNRDQLESLSKALKDNADVTKSSTEEKKKSAEEIKRNLQDVQNEVNNSAKSASNYATIIEGLERRQKSLAESGKSNTSYYEEVTTLLDRYNNKLNVVKLAHEAATKSLQMLNVELASQSRIEAWSKKLDGAKNKLDGAQNAVNSLGKTLTGAANSFKPLSENLAQASEVTEGFKKIIVQANEKNATFWKSMADGKGPVESLKNTFPALNGSVKGFGTALAETGIGLIVMLVANLIEKFKEWQPLMDVINGVMDAAGTVFKMFTNTIFDLLTGASKISDFFAHPIDSITNMGKSMAKAAEESYKLGKAQRDLETATSAQEVANEKLKNVMSDLEETFSNSNLPIKARQKALDELKAKEKEYHEQNKKLSDSSLDIAERKAIRENGLSDEKLKKLKNEGIVYAATLRKDGDITEEQFEAIKKAQLAVIALDKEHGDYSKKFASDATKLTEEVKKEADEAAAAAKQKAQERAEKRKQNADKAKQEHQEAEKEKLDSIGRMAQATLDGFSKEIEATNKHFKELKLKYRGHNDTVAQLEKERIATLRQVIDKFQRDDTDKLQAYHDKLNAIGASERKLAFNQLEKDYQNENKDVNNIITENQKLINDYDVQIKKLQSQPQTQKTRELLNQLKENRVKAQKSIEDAKGILSQLQAKNDNDKKELTKTFNQKDKTELFKKDKDQLEGDIIQDQNKGDWQKEFKDKQLLLDKEYQQAINAENLTATDKLKIQKNYNDNTAQLNKAKQDAEVANQKKYLQGLNSVASAVTSIFGKNTVAARIAFKAQQAAAAAQVIIETKRSIMNIWSANSGIPFVGVPKAIAETAIVAAAGASNLAAIVKQKPGFAAGGQYISDGRGALLPGYSRTDNTNAYLRSGEAVVVSEAMRNPWARNLVSAINVAHGGRDFSIPNMGRGYAIGGIFTDGGNANRYYSQPVNDQKDLANTLAYQMLNNFPPIYVDVKDVNNQQNILAQTVNRVNL